MPKLEKHPSTIITKMLLMGDPGSGKTGALASLASAGYQLHIMDLDNGLDSLRNVLMDPKTPYDKEAYKNVNYITITEKPAPINAIGGMAVPRGATVWNRIASTLTSWTDGEEKLGSVYSWGPKDILIIDSLTLAGIAAFNYASIQNAGNKNQDNRMNYFHAQNYLEFLIQCLYGDDVKCNVIVTAHVTFIGDEADQTLHGYPTTTGRALSTKIGRYFNTVLLVKSDMQGKRKIHTNPVSRIELKNTAPFRVKPTYDLAFGLAEYFRDVQAPVGNK